MKLEEARKITRKAKSKEEGTRIRRKNMRKKERRKKEKKKR